MGARIDWSHPLAQGLVGCWALNEGAGLLNDVVTGTRGPSNSATWAGTPYGTGLVFNGTSQSVNCGSHPAWSITGPLTLVALASPPASGVTQQIIDFKQSANTGGYTLTVGSTNKVAMVTASAGSQPSASSASSVDGKWHLYAASMSSTAAGGVSFFRDGVADGTGQLTVFPAAYGSGLLGTNPTSSGAWLSGSLALVSIWARALSAQEHAVLAANPWQLFVPHTLWALAATTTGVKSRRSIAARAGSRGVV